MFGRKAQPVKRTAPTRAIRPAIHPARTAQSPRARKARAPAPRRRGYAMAKLGGETNDWFSGDLTADQAIYGCLRRMRNRARDLACNDDYTRRFIHLAKTNVIGHRGIQYRARCVDYRGSEAIPADVDNLILQTAFGVWSQMGGCTVDRRQSFIDVLEMLIECWIVDGEFICRKVKGYDNEFGYALQPIDADRLDERLNREKSANLNEIRMGVEIDEWTAPVAYHFLDGNQSVHSYGYAQQRHIPVPAAEIIHVYRMERPGQTRGVTYLAPIALRKKMLDGFMHAVVVGARAAACKMDRYEPYCRS